MVLLGKWKPEHLFTTSCTSVAVEVKTTHLSVYLTGRVLNSPGWDWSCWTGSCSSGLTKRRRRKIWSTLYFFFFTSSSSSSPGVGVSPSPPVCVSRSVPLLGCLRSAQETSFRNTAITHATSGFQNKSGFKTFQNKLAFSTVDVIFQSRFQSSCTRLNYLYFSGAFSIFLCVFYLPQLLYVFCAHVSI